MFTIEKDGTINVTRGDILYFDTSAQDKETKVPYIFQPGDIVRMAVYGKKDCENVVMQKDFLVELPTEKVAIFLDKKDTTFGDIINKPTVYWYEIVLNPEEKPQTFVAYDEEGARIFRLYPEGAEIPAPDEEVKPEDIPVIDDELDPLSNRPVRNKAIAKAVISLNVAASELNANADRLESEIAVERARIDNLAKLKEGSTSGDAELQDLRVTYDGEVYDQAGEAIRIQLQRVTRAGYLLSSSSNAVEFDTNSKTVTINNCFVFNGYRRYDNMSDMSVVLDYSSAGTTACVVYNKKTAGFQCIDHEYYDTKTQILLFVFLPATLSRYRKSVVSGLSSYRVNGYLVNGENNYVRKGLFVVRNSIGFEFDTVNNTLTIPNEAYLFYGEKRFALKGLSCEIPTSGTTQKHIVYNTETNNIECVKYTDYLYAEYILIATITYKDLNTTYSNDLPCGYKVDGVIYSKYGTTSSGGLESVYVSTSGSDSNIGSKEAPLRTIQQALNSGANKVIVESGTYAESLVAENRAALSIVGGWSKTFNGTTAPERDKVIIECGESIAFTNDNTTALISAAYESATTDKLYKVFVSYDLALDDGGTRSKGYYVNLWKKKGIGSDVKLTPVLTLDECKSKSDSWYYDGTTIYANTTNEGEFVLASDKVSGSIFTNINELTIEDVVFAYASGDNLKLQNCNQVTLRNCEFNYSGCGDGVSMDYCNGQLDNCKAYYNRNDGFNFHGYGDTTLNNCNGSYNFDDGVSHHDGCTATFMGGEYSNNGKGGIAPAHGAIANIYDVILYGNEYGFYIESDEVVPLGKMIKLVGCVAYDNTYGMSIRNYHTTTYNCKFTGNRTPVTLKTSNEYTSHTEL